MPVAVVDDNVRRAKPKVREATIKAAHAFVAYLYTPQSQQAFAECGFRWALLLQLGSGQIRRCSHAEVMVSSCKLPVAQSRLCGLPVHAPVLAGLRGVWLQVTIPALIASLKLLLTEPIHDT